MNCEDNLIIIIRIQYFYRFIICKILIWSILISVEIILFNRLSKHLITQNKNIQNCINNVKKCNLKKKNVKEFYNILNISIVLI